MLKRPQEKTNLAGANLRQRCVAMETVGGRSPPEELEFRGTRDPDIKQLRKINKNFVSYEQQKSSVPVLF